MKLITIFLCFIMSSTVLYASKARMIALGQDANEGSFYLDDPRNIFKNPASINFMKNYFLTEWGEASDGADDNNSPHAEGVVVKEIGNFIYGLYLGSENDSYNDKKGSGFLKQDNRIDVLFAGDAGIQWAGHLYYANSFDESSGFDKSNEGIGFGLGAMFGNMSGFANFVFKDNSKGAASETDRWERDLSFNIGGTYRLGMFSFFSQYRNGGYGQNLSSAETTGSVNEITVGVGMKVELEGNSRFIMDLSFISESEKITGAVPSETKSNLIPLVLGLESQVNDWLILRGSIKQNIVFGKKTFSNLSQTDFNSTNVSSGATLLFGKIKLDGLIGMTTYSRVGSEANHGVLALDNLITRVAFSYWF